MVAAVKANSSHLRDVQPAPDIAVIGRVAVEHQDAVHEVAQGLVRLSRAVQQQDGCLAPRQEVAQREKLALIAQRRIGKLADLADRVDDDAVRVGPLDLGHQHRHRLAQLDDGGVEDRLLGRVPPRAALLVDLHALERPSVRRGDLPQCSFGLQKGDEDHRFALRRTVPQEL